MALLNNSLTKLFLLILVLVSLGCGKGDSTPPASEVTVSKPIVQEVIEWDEYSGRLESPKTAEISPRVSGVIVSAPFQEGGLVKEGDVLFKIDDRSYKAELLSKNADVARAEALTTQSQLNYNRYQKIKDSKAISAEDYDQALATLKQSQAQLASAKAAQEIAKLNLEWTEVTAPISGRVSKKLVTEGNLVSASQTTPLTTITSIDPLYCYVNIPERTFLKYQENSLRRKEQNNSEGKTVSTLKLENEKSFSRTGEIDFIDNHVDPNTGTVQIRGVIPNNDHSLSTGLFARMRVPASLPYKALLIPDVAVGTDQTAKFVYVITEENKVEFRKVEIGVLFGKLRKIEKGLNENERVIVNGLQRAKPGVIVQPKEVPIEQELIALLEPFITTPSTIKTVNFDKPEESIKEHRT